MTTTIHHVGLGYCCINAVLLLSIIAVACKTAIELKKTQNIKSLSFISALLYHIIAFIGISTLFYESFSKLVSYKVEITADNPLSFGCNAVFSQNTALIISLFIRTQCIFCGTPWQLSTSIVRFFILAFIVSTAVFIVLLTTTTHSLVICAFTLCLFNIFFITAITTLFLSKLKSVCKMWDDNKEFIGIIKKITILTLISMSITVLCCALLLLQAAFWQNSYFVHVFSEWFVAINIYTNFVCFSLSFSFFAKPYSKICKCMDSNVCKELWNYVLLPTKATLASDSSIRGIAKCDVVSDVDVNMDQHIKINSFSKLNAVELLKRKFKFMTDDADVIIDDILTLTTSTTSDVIIDDILPTTNVPKLTTTHSAPLCTSKTVKTRCNSMESI